MSYTKICDICGYVDDPKRITRVRRFYTTTWYGRDKSEFDICDECLKEIHYRINERRSNIE